MTTEKKRSTTTAERRFLVTIEDDMHERWETPPVLLSSTEADKVKAVLDFISTNCEILECE